MTLNNLETWEDFDREREKRFITLLGGDDDARKFWKWLGDQTKRKLVDLSVRCACGAYLGQYHGENCEKRRAGNE